MHSYLHSAFQDLLAIAKQNKQRYASAAPFPYICFEHFFDPGFLNQVRDEFPDLATLNALHFNNPNEKKFASKGDADFGPKTRELIYFLQSAPFLQFLQELTSIEEALLGDPYLIGGGLHEIKRGGLLKVHADFNKHSLTGLDRRLNVLIYLNRDWKEEYVGHFELWDKEKIVFLVILVTHPKIQLLILIDQKDSYKFGNLIKKFVRYISDGIGIFGSETSHNFIRT